jgi:hypothetical protein
MEYTARSPEEFKVWLTEALRRRGAWLPGLSITVAPMSKEEVPQTGRAWGGNVPAPAIGFRISFAMHRSTRELSEAALHQLRAALQIALANEWILEGRLILEGIGEHDELREEAGVFSWTVPVFLEVEVAAAA